MSRLQPGGNFETCIHAYEKGIYVFEGEIEVLRGGELIHLPTDGYALIPYAAPHAIRNAGTRPARWFEILSPQPKPASAFKDTFFTGDNAWVLTSAALVLFMTGPGLALFYGGLVRKKNVLSTMMQSFAMMAMVTLLWALCGYSLVFGEGCPFLGDLRYLFLNGVGAAPNTDYAPTIPHLTFMAYQMMFAIITPALIAGAFAERVRFSAMILFSTIWLFIVYFPVAHMVWGKGGFLNPFLGGSVPVFDFAGGTVVHITSGFSALVAASSSARTGAACASCREIRASACSNCRPASRQVTTRSMVPICAPSTISRSPPRALAANSSMRKRPWERVATASAKAWAPMP